MKIEYVPRKFLPKALKVIDQANSIIEEYTKGGYDLTLRQLYYQFVSRNLIANSQKEYSNLGMVINKARLAGLVSWEAVVDRTRNLQKNSHWEDPKEFMQNVVPQFAIDKWENQPKRVEVWIEKDALLGVIERICNSLDVPYFSCRGYTSQSEMWAAGQRLSEYIARDQQPAIIHLGDHDPSGKDMTRDIEERLEMFCGHHIEVNRIALNIDQVKFYKPPSNPAKTTDGRARKYIEEFGTKSWELDALDPKVLRELVENSVNENIDGDSWIEALRLEKKHKNTLATITKGL